ncbi:6347_t:CDS:2 [Rhizophagus irregularis]|nr:6347_t:CDS:2 [Rhizophagus irregularis]
MSELYSGHKALESYFKEKGNLASYYGFLLLHHNTIVASSLPINNWKELNNHWVNHFLMEAKYQIINEESLISIKEKEERKEEGKGMEKKSEEEGRKGGKERRRREGREGENERRKREEREERRKRMKKGEKKRESKQREELGFIHKKNRFFVIGIISW